MPICISPIKSRVVRFTRLDSCGAPAASGTKNSLVTDGFIKVTFKMNYTKGVDFSQTNAWGDPVITDQDADRLKNVSVNIDFVKVDPDSWGMCLGTRTIAQVQTTGGPSTVGDTIGNVTSPTSGGANFALEAWTKLSGLCSPSGTQIWLYTVFPYLYNGTLGDYDLGDARVDFQYNALSHGAGVWGSAANGPYTTVPSPDFTINPSEHYGQILTTVQPPAAVCGAVAIA